MNINWKFDNSSIYIMAIAVIFIIISAVGFYIMPIPRADLLPENDTSNRFTN